MRSQKLGYCQRVRRIRLNRRRAVIAILAVGALIEIPLLLYFLGSRSDGGVITVQAGATTPAQIGTLNPHPIAGRFRPDDTKLADCSDQRCFEQAFGNIAYYQGPKVAMGLVAKQYAGGADPSCHRVVHMVGAASLARFKGNIARTFAAGSSLCWSGYYHGVLERAFRNVTSFDAKSLGAKARSLCRSAQVSAHSWLAYQCLHGLGHGLMITTAYQLPLSLKVCKELGTAWDQTSCKGGVFMENILTSYGGKSPWVRDNDPVFPCDWVAREDKYTCYQQVTTRMIRVFGVNWKRMAQVCARVEREWIATCFGSFGQNASVLASRDPQRTAKTCAIARAYGGEAACFRYAAEDIAGTYSGGKRAAVLCNIAPQNVRGPCYRGIGLLLRYLRPTQARRTAECKSITRDRLYVAQCLLGTRKTTSIPGLNRSSTAPAR